MHAYILRTTVHVASLWTSSNETYSEQNFMAYKLTSQCYEMKEYTFNLVILGSKMSTKLFTFPNAFNFVLLYFWLNRMASQPNILNSRIPKLSFQEHKNNNCNTRAYLAKIGNNNGIKDLRNICLI